MNNQHEVLLCDHSANQRNKKRKYHPDREKRNKPLHRNTVYYSVSLASKENEQELETILFGIDGRSGMSYRLLDIEMQPVPREQLSRIAQVRSAAHPNSRHWPPFVELMLAKHKTTIFTSCCALQNWHSDNVFLHMSRFIIPSILDCKSSAEFDGKYRYTSILQLLQQAVPRTVDNLLGFFLRNAHLSEKDLHQQLKLEIDLCVAHMLKFPHSSQKRKREEEVSKSSTVDDRSTKTIFLGGIVSSINEEDILKYLSPFGQIQRLSIVPHKRIAFVEFEERTVVDRVLQTPNMRILNIPIRAELAKQPFFPQNNSAGCSHAVHPNMSIPHTDILRTIKRSEALPNMMIPYSCKDNRSERVSRLSSDFSAISDLSQAIESPTALGSHCTIVDNVTATPATKLAVNISPASADCQLNILDGMRNYISQESSQFAESCLNINDSSDNESYFQEDIIVDEIDSSSDDDIRVKTMRYNKTSNKDVMPHLL